MRNGWVYTVYTLILMALIVAGCGAQDVTSDNVNEDQVDQEVNEPVTVTAAVDGSYSEEFDQLLSSHVQKKYPYITLDMIEPTDGSRLDDLLAARAVPDIIFTYNGMLSSYQERELLYDMNPLVEKMQFDLDRIEPNYVTDVKIASAQDELYAFPYETTFHALYYNKDIFDTFGVGYPQDGLTREETVELGRQVTRTDGGIRYRGLDPGGGIIWISQPLSLAAVDPETERAAINNDQWKKVFELVKSIYTIPGNEPEGNPTEAFMRDKTLAMLGQLNIIAPLEQAQQEGLDWDVIQYPSYPERPNTFGNASVYVATVTPTSEHKEHAFRVLEVLLSDDFQMTQSRAGKISVLKNPEVIEAFGVDFEFLKDKNLEGIFKSKPVIYPVASQYRQKGEAIARAKFDEFWKGVIDVNTALSQAEEEINQMIEAEMNQ